MKNTLQKISLNSTVLRWILLALIAITSIYKVQNPGLGFLVFLLPVTFALLHSLKYFGKKHTLVVFLIIIAISYTAEFLGVHTGQIFGHYYYNASPNINGFLIAGVPPLVTFSYISMGYTSYLLARIILGKFGKLQGAAFIGIPIIAAMFMTVWDMAFDPIASYVQQRYIWETGGAYFGVPLRNFVGWFLTTFTFFSIINIYLNYAAKAKDYIDKPSRLFLSEPVVLMGANAAAIIAHIVTGRGSVVQQNMALVALFGLGTFVTISVFRLLDKNLTKD